MNNLRQLPTALRLLLSLGTILALMACIIIALIGRSGAPTQIKRPTSATEETSADDTLVAGKHVVFHGSLAERENARRLVPIADHAIESYAYNLNIPAPDAPIPVTLFDTVQDYEHADALYNEGRTKTNLAFTNLAHVYMLVMPRPAQSLMTDGCMMEMLLAHELCHAVHQRLYPNYNRQPGWLIEGVADAWAEQAITSFTPSIQARTLWFGAQFIYAHQADAAGKLLPLSQLMDTSFYGLDSNGRALRYNEAFTLVHMLDNSEPNNMTRHTTFRAFLEEVNHYDLNDLNDRINARFRTLFAHNKLTTLQTEYRQWLSKIPLPAWDMYTRDAYLLPDGSLVTEAFPKSSALVFTTGKKMGPDLTLHVQAEVADVGAQQADLLFGREARDNYFVLSFQPGFVTLMHFNGTYQSLLSLPIAPGQFGPGKHSLEMVLTAHSLLARLDGKSVMQAKLGSGAFPSGEWGVGCYDGRVLFRNATATSGSP